MKAKNEALQHENQGLIHSLSKITTQNSGLEQEFEQHKAIWQSEMMQMRRDFELQIIQGVEVYAAELQDAQAKYRAIVQELKEEKAELITKHTVAQAALIEKFESISLAVPQMMQDLVRNLSKQATDFKDGCASLTRNMKETSSEDTGESGVVKERKPETRQSGQAATKEGHGPEKAATPLPSLSTNNTPLARKPKGVKGPSRSPKVGSNTEDGGCVT